MAHRQQFEFIEKVKGMFPDYFQGKRVLEFGSLNINGSVRQFFDTPDYTGYDIVDGKDVDMIGMCHEVKVKPKADVVISCEMLEHDVHWRQSIMNMYELVKTGGLLVITCATEGRPEHGTTATTPADSPGTLDYYLNLTEADFRTVWNCEKMFHGFEFTVNEENHDLQFWGIKK